MTAPNDPANEPENDLNPDGPLPPAMKPERPRDELGRPLPAGEPNRLELPYFDEMTLEECHEEAIRLFDAGNPAPLGRRAPRLAAVASGPFHTKRQKVMSLSRSVP